MANVKSIIKKLVNAGYSEDKLMMMSEKEIREAYKLSKEEGIMTINKKEIMDKAIEAFNGIINNETINLGDIANFGHLVRISNVHNIFYINRDEMIAVAKKIGMPTNRKTSRTAVCKYCDDLTAEYKNRINDVTVTEELSSVEETNSVSVGDLDITDVDMDYYRDGEYVAPADYDKIHDGISVGDLDITDDNTPIIDESAFVPVEFNDELATKILEGVIRQADTNRAHNFISDWMLTSIISELIIGLKLKDKGVEHYKTFTDDQKKNIAAIRKAFIERARLIVKHNNSKITGYYIPAKMLVWGRHKYLGAACVYRYVNNNKILAEYHVSLNGIKNVATGNITALDAAAYETLDTKCVFVM